MERISPWRLSICEGEKISNLGEKIRHFREKIRKVRRDFLKFSPAGNQEKNYVGEYSGDRGEVEMADML